MAKKKIFGNRVRRCIKYFVISLALATFYYIIFALFVNTDTERKLHQENKMYEKVYPEMSVKERLLSDVIDGLEIRDNNIHENIFNTTALPLDEDYADVLLLENDTIKAVNIVGNNATKIDQLTNRANSIDERIQHVTQLFQKDKDNLPPMNLPIENVEYTNIGASVGQKLNPFYKVVSTHNGLDILAAQGTPVLASADGKVSDVIRSQKGLGNIVVIDHENGYITRYAHLSDRIRVGKGQRVKKGSKIGEVGMSGSSFTPHLHYEVIKDSVYMNPVNFFFACLDPQDYANMMIMSVNAGQSMD